MDPKQLVEKTINFDSPERIPRQAWILPWAEENYPQELSRLKMDFPDDITMAPQEYLMPLDTNGKQYEKGTYIDEWGCYFDNVHDGVIGVVRKPMISKWEDLGHFKPPEATLAVNREIVNAFCGSTDQFILAGSWVRPFERFQFIRTMEQGFIDLIEDPPELPVLLNKIHDHYCKEVEVWAKTDIDAISLMDDWGTQNGLLVSPQIFRKYFIPMYKDYVEIARNYGKYVFMHSDGEITEIIPDLIEVGIDALNSQLFCMDIEKLGELFRGKISFWGEIDRQHLLPKGTKEDIKKAVNRVHDNLYSNGGVIAQCEFGPAAKPENVFTVFKTWDSIKL